MEKEKKTSNIINKIIMLIIAIASVVAIYFVGGALLRTAIVNLKVHEMTEEEKELLISEYPNYEERISRGKLVSFQYEKLKEIRFAMSYLEEKYPGYKFHIRNIDGGAGSYEECTVVEENSMWKFKVHVYEEKDNFFEAEDNFYTFLLEEQYDIYLEEKFQSEVEEVVEINSYITSFGGKEYGIDIDIEDIITEEIQKVPSVYVHIAASKMTMNDCAECMEKLRLYIEEKDISGIYSIMFWNMTEEEMLIAEEKDGLIIDGLIMKEENQWKMEIY